MWGWLALIAGILYGWLTPGKQDKAALFKKGLIVGVIVAVVAFAIGILLEVNILGLGAGFVSILISAVIITLLFILGVWLGDLIEGATKKKTA